MKQPPLLPDSLEMMTTALDAVQDVVVWIQDNYQILWCNAAVQTLMGLNPKHIKGQPFKTVFPLTRQGRPISTDESPVVRLFKADLETADYDYCQGDRHLMLQITGQRIQPQPHLPRPSQTGLLIIRDVTETKQALTVQAESQTAVLRSHALMQAQLDASLDGILVIDEYRRILGYNRRFCEMWSVPNSIRIAQDDQALWPFLQSQLAKPTEFLEHLDHLNQHPQDSTRAEIELTNGHIFERYIASTITLQGDYYGRICYFRDITEHKQVEQAIRDSERKYRQLFENSQVGIGQTRLSDGLFLNVNQRYADIMGYQSPQDLIGKHFSTDFYVDPADRDRILRLLQKHGEVKNYEEQVKRPDGSKIWLLLSLQLNREDRCIDFVVADITDRKRAEEALQNSEQILRTLYDSIGLAIITGDQQGVVDYNPVAQKLLGYTHEQFMAMHAGDLSPPKQPDGRPSIEAANEHIAFAMKNGHDHFEWIHRRADGRDIPVDIYLTPVTLGDRRCVQAIIYDLSDRKRREEVLKQIFEQTSSNLGKQFFKACTQCMAELLRVKYTLIAEFVTDERKRVGTLAFWTGETFGDNFEYDLEGTPCANVLAGTTSQIPHSVQSYYPRDNDLAALGVESYIGVPIYAPNGQVMGHLAAMDTQPLDIKKMDDHLLILQLFSARAGAELQRKENERVLQLEKEKAEAANRAKSIFLANMSHELRTPLNAILGFAQLMSQDTSLTPQQSNSLSIINRSGEHLLNIINDVLEMSKIEAGRVKLNPSSFDLHRLLQTLSDLFTIRATAQNISLKMELPPELPQYLTCDEGKFRQVLINLLSNAIKFTQEGQVTLRIRVAPASATHPEKANTSSSASPTSSPSSFWQLWAWVQDTGCGIAPERLKTIFSPFETSANQSSEGGTGLGLAISRQFIHLMGGQLEVSSDIGKGSIFRFWVPVTFGKTDDRTTYQPLPPVKQLATNQPEFRILIVDDTAENRELLVQLLQGVGFQVHQASNGQEAITQWQSTRPHLIWMDLRMAGMDGYEATRQIRVQEKQAKISAQARTIIIALTATAFEEQRSKILEAGCDDVVHKPFQSSLIFEKMATHLKVRYIYQTDSVPTGSVGSTLIGSNSVSEIGPEDLQVMPVDWRAALHQAAIQVDSDQIAKLIDQIPQAHSALADAIAKLTHQFNYDTLMALTSATLTSDTALIPEISFASEGGIS